MNGEFLSTCLDYMVLPVCLPPHTTHFSQPLDVSIFSPPKAAYRMFFTDVRRVEKKEFGRVPSTSYMSRHKRLPLHWKIFEAVSGIQAWFPWTLKPYVESSIHLPVQPLATQHHHDPQPHPRARCCRCPLPRSMRLLHPAISITWNTSSNQCLSIYKVVTRRGLGG